MKSTLSALLLGMACLVQGPCAFAQTAPSSIAGLIKSGAPLLLDIPTPYGTFGNLSLGTLGTLPLISSIPLPEIGTIAGVPVIGSISIAQGVVLFESVAPLQMALPGLPN